MDRAKTKVTGAQEYFAGELRAVMEKHQIEPLDDSFKYLVQLLVRSIDAENFFVKRADGKLENNLLVELYSEYMQGDIHTKRVALQRLGDVCMIISGFFAESLQRKTVDIGYYLGMGGTAYRELSSLQLSNLGRAVYTELSDKFGPFSNVLNEMSERSGIQSNKDLIRLYERWLNTGSDRLKGVLQEHGITAPIFVDIKQKH